MIVPRSNPKATCQYCRCYPLIAVNGQLYENDGQENKHRCKSTSLTCVECGCIPSPVTGDVIYPHRSDLSELTFWLCECGAYVGSHKQLGNPLGRPAGAETRSSRNAAHTAFDPIWRDGITSRTNAYRWLARQLGIDVADCHIANFDAETCKRVIEIVTRC